MRKIVSAFFFVVVGLTSTLPRTVFASSPRPPFTQCPAVGASSGCAVLIVLNADGTTTLLKDPGVKPLSGKKGSLIGVLNNSASSVATMQVSGSGIFGFDGHGICSGRTTPVPMSCPFGSTGYEGPKTRFSIADPSHGTVLFTDGLASGASTYLSLQEAVSAAAIPLPQTTKLTYTGPTALVQGRPISLSAVLKANGTRPISGRAVVVSVGSQSCTGTTDASGTARCVITSVSAPLGRTTLTASFAGDLLNPPAKDTKPVVIFTFLSSGSFVLGDQTVASASPNTPLTWWGAQWQKLNNLSGGSAPAAFKGFANTLSMPSPSCANTWTTSPGKNTRPPTRAPSYMAVIVTSTVTKSKNTISGNTASIVIVQTNPGYTNNPGRAGTGTMVAIFCQSPNVPQVSGSVPPKK